MVKRLLAIAFLCCISSIVSAQGGASDTLIQEVLELSGAKQQIAQLTEIMEQQLARQRSSMKSKDFALVDSILYDAYDPDTLYQIVVDYFKESYDEKQCTSLLDWLRTPLSQTLSTLEIQASTPDGQEDMEVYARDLQYKSAAQARIDVVHQLDNAIHATELVLKILTNTFRELMLAITPVLSSEKRVNEGELQLLTEQMRSELEPTIKEATKVSFLFTYRSVSADELRRYIRFYESETGQWFSRVSSEGLIRALTHAIRKAGREIAERFTK
ncbi:MAG: hypothetical protein HY707_02385 [Ignavibacteriae bacterium]|nr:hypothetical protein [Ignavibacteriota bacterium]